MKTCPWCVYCGIAWSQAFQECFEFITFHYSNCCIFIVKTTRNNQRDRQEQICTIQGQVTTLRMAFTIQQKILKKNPTNFSSLRKGRYAPGYESLDTRGQFLSKTRPQIIYCQITDSRMHDRVYIFSLVSFASSSFFLPVAYKLTKTGTLRNRDGDNMSKSTILYTS